MGPALLAALNKQLGAHIEDADHHGGTQGKHDHKKDGAERGRRHKGRAAWLKQHFEGDRSGKKDDETDASDNEVQEPKKVDRYMVPFLGFSSGRGAKASKRSAQKSR